ncbi:uncharacterized protein F5891DRAFT_1186062 [Suillus fuscotomentosus]|uniref:Uncharacterized protein n=1 Tax=Suillus fuscotomentosus TaxID=1912939 RepID=A0AAD4EAZ2_9AGAM|nr:uncharacterized protein F5891DRAFT_1186062 [Suillus fuscotomentosus]KAG1902919.1 hypothetical protein F5891DRAFT_1186062 [Suillus fuscotomentosus]
MTPPVQPSKQTPSNTIPSPAEAASYTSCFSMASIAALTHMSAFAQGFSNNKHQAAAMALLRHDAHTNKKTLTQDNLVEAGLQDVFDVISVQDHLDSGISLIIHCAASAK